MCIVHYKKFGCGHEYNDWLLCDDWRDLGLRYFKNANGENQPDCPNLDWNYAQIYYSHCCTLECCVSNVKHLQSKVRECEHRLILQAGVRLSIDEVFNDENGYGPHLRKAQEDSFIAAWRHLNLCATVVRLGHPETQGIVTHTRTYMQNHPYKDIFPDNQALQIFEQFSYEFKEARQRARILYGTRVWYEVEMDAQVEMLKSTAPGYNGLGQVLWLMIHLTTPQEVLFQPQDLPAAPELSSEQKASVDNLISEQCYADEDRQIVDIVLSLVTIRQPSSHFTTEWDENEDSIGEESRVAFHKRLQHYLIEEIEEL